MGAEGIALGSAPTEQRVEVLLAVPRDFGMGIPLEQLQWLMAGAEDPSTPAELERWLLARPSLAVVENGTAFAPGHARPESPGRSSRAIAFQRCAESFIAGPLAPAARLTRCLAITGSVAYGNPEQGDDLDFLAVVREGALWLFLAWTYLCVRLRAPREVDGPSSWCFNHVLSEVSARTDYARSRGLLFAREALMAKPLVGGAFYRELLESAPWMREELPRLYSRCLEELPKAGSASQVKAVPLALRAVNLLLYVPLAAYLQAQGLLRNWRFRRTGRTEECFRTQTYLTRLAYVSDRFDRLIAAYDRASARPRAAAPT